MNVDVQIYIMAFLSARDLSTLMRTCRYFLDACLLPLCVRSRALLSDSCSARLRILPSFCRFLRINAGPSSREHLIKELWITVHSMPTEDEKYFFDPRFIPIRKQWSNAFLDVLRHCHNVRRLRIDRWFLRDISYSLLMNTIGSSLNHLEDLTIPTPYDTDINILRRFALLPLRSITFLKYSHRHTNFHVTSVSLEGLPRSLMELDIHGCTPVDTPFPQVRKLAIRDTTSETFVADATAAFPNLTHLVLRHNSRLHYQHDGPPSRPLLDDARTRNKIQWDSQGCEAWPSLSSIWVHDSFTLYSLGLSKRVSCLSISLDTGRHGKEAPYVAPVLADTSPSLLELRINMDRSISIPAGWHSHFGPSAASVLRLTLLLQVDSESSVTDKQRMINMLETINAMLPAFTSLTHLLVRFVPVRRPYGINVSKKATRGTIQNYLRIFAGANMSLRWVGYEIHPFGLKCWDILRAGPGGRARRLEGLELIELSNVSGLAVVNTERMREFKDVKPYLTVLS
ncbi:hypothetical protein LXA43DRAFT_1093816 [Ganoderma leucocontextum]|nr:hypothetical protein LXA43DRAFT_1093816 [Ganoderma leucocontextum]